MNQNTLIPSLIFIEDKPMKPDPSGGINRSSCWFVSQFMKKPVSNIVYSNFELGRVGKVWFLIVWFVWEKFIPICCILNYEFRGTKVWFNHQSFVNNVWVGNNFRVIFLNPLFHFKFESPLQ